MCLRVLQDIFLYSLCYFHCIRSDNAYLSLGPTAISQNLQLKRRNILDPFIHRRFVNRSVNKRQLVEDSTMTRQYVYIIPDGDTLSEVPGKN